MTSKGREIKFTSQLELRKDRSRWVGRSRYGKSDTEFIYNAGASYYNPNTSPVKASKHGFGLAVDFSIGGRNNFSPLQTAKYVWMVKNAHRFGFVRTVKSEEWHFEYIPEKAKNGPYGAMSGKGGANKFYSDIGLADGMFNY